MPRLSLFYGIALTALATPLLLACPNRIGDPCRVSTDCSTTEPRHCDLSVRIDGEGECIIEGCGRDTCPRRSACIASFGAEFISKACDPSREDIATCAMSMPEGEPCQQPLPPLDDCLPNEFCLPEGLCADELSARMSCRATCKNNRDCRSGYSCRWTGSQGVYRAFDPNNPDDLSPVRICMPNE